MSVLSLIGEMGRQMPRVSFLITSGTATSAKMVANHLPPRTVHQFAPLDAPGPVRRFIRHWRPELRGFRGKRVVAPNAAADAGQRCKNDPRECPPERNIAKSVENGGPKPPRLFWARSI